MYKIIGADGKEYGPIPADVLRQWIAEGRADAQTRILPEGTTEWKPIAAFPEFATLPLGNPPPLPTGPVPGFATAQNQVSAPAIALMITAILGVLYHVCSIIGQAMLPMMMSQIAQQNPQLPALFTAMSTRLQMVLGGVGILSGGFVFFAALKMKRLENYSLAITASVLALIPCLSPCCLLGVPLGIWALVVLNKPEVRGAFH